MKREEIGKELDRLVSLVLDGTPSKAIDLLENLMLEGMFRDVRDFQQKYGQSSPETPQLPSAERREFRKKLHEEESKELTDELTAGNLPGILHEAVDNIVISLGTLASCGMSPVEMWKAVHRANMLKEPNPGGKPTKPPGWEPADAVKILARQGRIES